MQINRELWIFGYDARLADRRDGSTKTERVHIATNRDDEDGAKSNLCSEYNRIGYAVPDVALIDKVKITLDLPALFQRGQQARSNAPARKPSTPKGGKPNER